MNRYMNIYIKIYIYNYIYINIYIYIHVSSLGATDYSRPVSSAVAFSFNEQPRCVSLNHSEVYNYIYI